MWSALSAVPLLGVRAERPGSTLFAGKGGGPLIAAVLSEVPNPVNDGLPSVAKWFRQRCCRSAKQAAD